MAYVRGNLALKEKKIQRTPERYRETTKVVSRKAMLSTQEKLLYLFTIVICSLVAGVIIWRYAQIYDLNMQMQKMDREMKAMKQEMTQMKNEVDMLSSPAEIMKKATELGYVARESGNEIDVSSSDSNTSNPTATAN
ncbi:cell division protein FtsL [Paenibacillus selenitireducens]|uniref:Cell division protein FtsL n=1 Tax=Paenibacillus selenitireducens TaxID=1324314 RepID=A0A1T2XEZ8_9BACL|nr:cell division protein FtsL [Paenibacillus selenitireducens]OPA78459.1 cell division protein FtsL [Paenibacillus selenitireducens]